MILGEAIDLIEGCDTLARLRDALQRIAEGYGFASFGFVDIGVPGAHNPLWLATSDPQWVEDYRANDFVSFDPAVSLTRRSNLPFTWSDIPLPRRSGKWKPAAHRIMEAARDFGFTEGLVVPFHFVDRLGRLHSVCCGFYWREPRKFFLRLPRHTRTDLHILMIYWSQRLLALTERSVGERRGPAETEYEKSFALSDRERSVLEWAARGKTMPETAVILGIALNTVESHMGSAMRKLDALNKTHAAAKAIRLGLIDV